MHYAFLPQVTNTPASQSVSPVPVAPESQPSSTTKNSVTQAPSASTSSKHGGQYVGWQIYIDNNSGFSISYPQEYNVTSSTSSGVNVINISPISAPSTPLISISCLNPKVETPASHIEVLVGLTKAISKLSSATALSISTATTIIAGYSAETLAVHTGSQIAGLPIGNGTISVFNAGSCLYQQTVEYDSGVTTVGTPASEASNKARAQSIVSTFKILSAN
jgi:hypothetical protein